MRNMYRPFHGPPAWVRAGCSAPFVLALVPGAFLYKVFREGYPLPAAVRVLAPLSILVDTKDHVLAGFLLLADMAIWVGLVLLALNGLWSLRRDGREAG